MDKNDLIEQLPHRWVTIYEDLKSNQPGLENVSLPVGHHLKIVDPEKLLDQLYPSGFDFDQTELTFVDIADAFESTFDNNQNIAEYGLCYDPDETFVVKGV